jgi:hypothetical protein
MTDSPIRLVSDDRRFEELEADARHASERYRLYRAKVYGPRPASIARLQELKREAERAEGTLARAREVATRTQQRTGRPYGQMKPMD